MVTTIIIRLLYMLPQFLVTVGSISSAQENGKN